MRGVESFTTGYIVGSLGSGRRSPLLAAIRAICLFTMAIGCAGGAIGFVMHLLHLR